MPDRKDPTIAAKEDYVPLQELVSAYCQKPEDVSFREHLGPAWRSLLGPNRWLMVAVDCLAAASILAIVFALFTPIFAFLTSGEWGNLPTPVVAVGTFAVACLCLLVRRRPASRPHQIIANAKGSRTPVSLFLRLHDHLKSGELVAYQDNLDHAPVKRSVWRAGYGWLPMLGYSSRWIGLRQIDQHMSVRRSDIEGGSIGTELWLCQVAHAPTVFADWTEERRRAVEGLLSKLSGPDKTITTAFRILDEYHVALASHAVRTNAIREVAERRGATPENVRNSTTDQVVRGVSKSFNERLRQAVEQLTLRKL
jgi:hypothetical protein